MSQGPGRANDTHRPSVAARVLVFLIGIYRWTAQVRQPRCRFHPTCSQYAVDAVITRGALRGSALAVRRIGRCHPWNPGGVDHVPAVSSSATVDQPTS